MTSVQLALDVRDLSTALAVLEQVRDDIDIVEAGTVLCLSEGLGCLGHLRKTVGDTPIVADIRIGRAGEMFAGLAFDNGADAVTVLAEAPQAVITGAIDTARKIGKKIEVELPHGFGEADILAVIALQPDVVIVHHQPGADFRSDPWIRDTLSLLTDTKSGVQVSLAGGLTADNLTELNPSWAIDIVVVGSNVVGNAQPRSVLQDIIYSIQMVRSEGVS